MKKHLSALFALVLLTTLNILSAQAQDVTFPYRSCDCGATVTAGDPTGPAVPIFTIGESSAADLATTTPTGTGASDYAFVVTDPSGNILGLSSDGSYDFSSSAPGVYGFTGIAYNQAQLTTLCSLIGTLCATPGGPIPPEVCAVVTDPTFECSLGGFFDLIGTLGGGAATVPSVVGIIDSVACQSAFAGLITVCTAVTENPAYTVEVVEGGPGLPDDCNAAAAIDLNMSNGPFDNTGATGAGLVDNCFGEGDFGGDGPSDDNSLWFTFTGDGGVWHIYTSNQCGGGVDLLEDGTYIEGGDTQMEIFSGTSCDDLISLDCSEDDLAYGATSPDGAGFFAGLTIPTEAGVTYYVMVDGFDGAAGQFCINAVAEPCGSLTVTSQTQLSICANSTSDITIDPATAGLGLELNGNTPALVYYILDATGENVLGVTAGTSADGLTLTIDGAAPPVADASFIVIPVIASNLIENGGNVFPQIDGGCESNIGAPVFVSILPADSPECAPVTVANDECINAIALDVTDGAINGPYTNVGATGDASLPPICFTDDASSDPADNFYDNNVWFTFVGTGEVITLTTDITGIDSTIANLDTQIGVYAISCDGEEIACGEDIDDANYLSTVTIATTAGVMYYVTVDGYYYNNLGTGYTGDFNIAVSAASVEPTCDADYGTVTAPANTTIACGGINDAPMAMGGATGDYTSAWVLTQGPDLVIINFNAIGVFDFTGLEPGLYTVHAFNYANDDLPIILGSIQFGVTTGADAAALIGAGLLCAELDVAGVQYELLPCAPECNADYGTIENGDPQIVCAGGSNAAINVTDGATGEYATIFALTSAPDLTILNINTDGSSVFDFTGLPAGNYKVHAFNFLLSQATTILGAVQVGTTTGFDVSDLITAGTICADLDAAGVDITLLAPLALNISEDCNQLTGEFSLSISPSGGLPEIDPSATYSLSGSINADIPFGQSVSQTFADATSYQATLTDGVCGTVVAEDVVTCTKCDNSAGTMSDATISCDGIASATASGFVIETNSVLIYALHTSADTTAGDILATNDSGTFDLANTPGAMNGMTYYISAVVGRDEDGDGAIDDLTDFCTSVAAGAPVSFGGAVVATVTLNCDSNDKLADFTISASGGTGSYLISGNLYNGPFTEGQSPEIILNKDDATYNVTITDENGCTDTYSTTTTCKVLPIEWLAFTGEVLAQENLLKWSVIELNNDYFTVERSTDGANFAALTTVDGAGTTSNATNYEYADKTAPAGQSYYRIKQTDFDGSVSYSNTIILSRGETSFGLVGISPVPATTKLTIAYNTVNNSAVKVVVYDAVGKLISSEVTTVGNNTYELNVNGYAAGMYFLTITDGANTATTKFVKQ